MDVKLLGVGTSTSVKCAVTELRGGVGSTNHRPKPGPSRHGRLGSVSASGFTKDGDRYRNAAYGVSAVTLSIDLDVGVGSVTITQR